MEACFFDIVQRRKTFLSLSLSLSLFLSIVYKISYLSSIKRNLETDVGNNKNLHDKPSLIKRGRKTNVAYMKVEVLFFLKIR